MTKRERHCRWCRRTLGEGAGRGRPREFCSQRCRQWDWVSRQRASALHLGDDEVIVSRRELEQLHDELYVLACAVDDARRDLAGRPTAGDLRTSLDWLLEAAAPLYEREIGAAAGS